MRAAVREAWMAFSAPLEGSVLHLYADVKGLVTIGVGNLVDPVAAAVHLPLRRPDGTMATRDEIVADWARVKNDPHAATRGHRYAATITTLRLTHEDVGKLVMGKLDANDGALLRRFPDWESWLADAQLATHSMAWACGAAFRFPRLDDALRRKDYFIAAAECSMVEEGNPGLKPRNMANRMLYRNAAMVQGEGLDAERLWWPRDLWADPPWSADDTPTQPEIRLDLLESDRPGPDWATVHALPDTNPNDDEPPEAA